MGKLTQPLMIIAAIALIAFPVGGVAFLGSIVGSAAAGSLATAIIGSGIAAGLGMAAGALGLGPKAPSISGANRDRMFASLDPTTPRKIAFGKTAFPNEIRHQEWTAVGSEEQGVLHRIFFHASHKVQSIDKIWLDDRLAWTLTGGVTTYFQDTGINTYFSQNWYPDGGSFNNVVIGDGSAWNSTVRRCTGLAYSWMTFRPISSDKDKPMDSPFSGGVPTRMTTEGRGAYVYDPRLDTTVGGSGSHRADNQNTWQFEFGAGGPQLGRNPALQVLWYLLGWRINGKLALGRGIPPSRIDMASFMAAANVCDETVTSAINGTEPRYRSDGVFSEADNPNAVLDTLKAACNGDLRDFGGILSFHIRHNDLANVSVQLSQDDLLGGFIWKQTPDLEETFNEVRGRYTDPSEAALYQLRDYPAVRVEPVDGIERSDSFDLPTVQSVSQCQRLAKMRLARSQYRGTFTGEFNARAWKAGVGKIVELTMEPLGWVNKKFRVLEMGVRVDGVVPMLLQEENADLYLWDNSDVASVAPYVPTAYDPANGPLRRIIDSVDFGATRNVWRGPWAAGIEYIVGDLSIHNDIVYETIVTHTSVAGAPPPNANWGLWFGTGAEATLSATITRAEVTLPASVDGIVAPADYASATGEWQIMAGGVDVTDDFQPITTALNGNPGTLDVSYVGRSYSVTGSFDAEDDYSDLTMKVTGEALTTAGAANPYSGVVFERTFRLIKQRSGATSDFTAPGTPTGLTLSSEILTQPDGTKQAYLLASWPANVEADLSYYRLFVRQLGGGFVQFMVSGTSWRTPAIAGLTYEAQLQAVDASGNVSASYPAGGGVVSHTVGGDNIPPAAPTALTAVASFRSIFVNWTNPPDLDLRGVEIWENTVDSSTTATRIATVNGLPSKPGGLTRSGLATNATRYYWLKAVDNSGNVSPFSLGVSATTAFVPAVDLSGTITELQIADGAVTAAKIAVAAINSTAMFAQSIRPPEILSALPTTGNYEGRLVFTGGKLYRYTGTAFTASVPAVDVTGQITSTQITDNAITTPKIAAGAVTAAEIAANSITAGQIAAGAVAASEIAAGAVIAEKLAANSVVAASIQAGAIATDKLAADSVTTAKIAAGAITAIEIAAGAILANHIAAGQVTSNHIVAGTIVADDILAGSLTGDRFATNTSLPGTITVGTTGVSIGVVQTQALAGNTAATNFNANNDRNGTTPTAPGVLATGSAVDHTINTDGSADISFEWTYSSSNSTTSASNIDGFIVYVRSSPTANTPYTITSAASDENVFFVPYDKRAIVLQGMPANHYYTFGVRAYRVVDTDIDATNEKRSPIVQPSLSSEAPYQPSASVAFSGDVTGTIDGTNTATVVSGASLGAQDPATRINASTTQITPGLIQVSGTTTLADWRHGSDLTKIDGGDVFANSITANKIIVGSRGLLVSGLAFTANAPALNRVSWTAGAIGYMDDNGVSSSVSITGNSTATAWTSGTQYLYWVRGETIIRMTTVLATASGVNNVIFATYTGGTSLVANQGRTLIDGSNIKTGTIEATRMKAGYLEASWANISVLRTATSGARLEIDTAQVRVYDSANTLRVRLGLW